MSTTEGPRSLSWSTALNDSAKLLPYLAFAVRVGLGLGLLNGGLGGILSMRPNSWGGVSGRSPGALGGLDVLLELFPYVELALGLGLVFGIFTTITALLSCAMALTIPLVMTVAILGAVMTGTGGVGYAYGYGPAALQFSLMTVGITLAAIPGFALVVLLSPLSINRFSVDALIFKRSRPIPYVGVDEDAKAEFKEQA